MTLLTTPKERRELLKLEGYLREIFFSRKLKPLRHSLNASRDVETLLALLRRSAGLIHGIADILYQGMGRGPRGEVEDIIHELHAALDGQEDS